MAAIWEPENYFRIQLDIEAYACEAQEKLGVIPQGTARRCAIRGAFEVARIREIEREVHHETIAFLTNVAEHVGPDARFVHLGMTSSDVLDTCLAVQLTQAADILLADLDGLLAALKRRAIEHKIHPTIARSHGVHAEPTTFGLKLAGHWAEFARNRERLVAARARKSRPARSPARSARSPISTRASRNMSPRSSACRRSRCRPRSSRATATPRSSWRWRSSPPRSSGLRPKSAISSAPRCARRRNISPRGKRARRRCRTSATRCCRKT